MKLVAKKQVVIRTDKPLLRRVREVAIDAGITDMDILSTLGGVRETGVWTDDQVTGGAGSVVFLVAIVDEAKAHALVNALKPLWDAYSLQITVLDMHIAIPADG
ncbi:MAG: hypothetical protein AAGM04_07295 [Pseudomonadota bacterium]